MDRETENTPVNLQELGIREQCDRIARKFLPKVETAIDILLGTEPLKGIIAWEKVAEFAVAKKSKDNNLPLLQKPNITINLIPAQREQQTKVIEIDDISDAELVE